MVDPDNSPICTRSTALPIPSRSVELATDYLVYVVDRDQGTKNGKQRYIGTLFILCNNI